MIILGINAYHGDSSACLVIDGRVICAIEEERIRRIKHWAGLPAESIKWCLKYTNLKSSDVDYIGISRNPSANIEKKILKLLTGSPSFNFIKNRISNVAKVTDLKSQIANALNVDASQIKARIENVEHHRAHIGSSFLVSPFEEAVCISVDGFGDFLSVMVGVAKETKIKVDSKVEYPHSLGIFYSAFTQFLGFWNYGDEYKVMGLSAYGKPTYLEKMRKVLRLKDNGLFELDTSYFLHDKEGVEMVWEGGQPSFGKIFSDKLIEEFGNPRSKESEINSFYQDIAASVQEMYEEAFFYILNHAYKKYGLDSIALAGGCIQNSLANGKITERTQFKNIFIPPASYDAGTAIGAAISVWYEKSNSKRSFIMSNPYLGPEYSKEEIQNEINNFKDELKKQNCETECIENLKTITEKTAEFIASGKIVGWFQGRTEFGPRALGNRSILADPRKKEMKDVLNERIKRREWFRPFAPSILQEKTKEWFEQDNPVPFMEKVYKIKRSKQKLISAVCHEDGTGRLQTVSYDSNPEYYSLISEFEKITGVPMLLNTSFNDNEPIVNTPNEALRCFLSTKMDILVLGDFLIIKHE